LVPGQECPSSDPDLAVTTSGGYDAVRSDFGQAAVAIDAFINNTTERCRYVDNNTTSNESIFVPFRSGLEWNAFIMNAPSFTDPWLCSRTMSTSIPPDPTDTNCHDPKPTSQPVTLPYARWPDPTTGQPPQQTVQVSFQCTDDSGNPWQEKATAVYQGLNSDTNNPSWQLVSLVYTTEAGNGVCGPANGNSYANAAAVNAAGLCSSGTASPAVVTDPGPWNWHCNGNGGSSVGCSAYLDQQQTQCGPPINGNCTLGKYCWPAIAPLCTNDGTPINVIDSGVTPSGTETINWDCTLNGYTRNYCIRIINWVGGE
jgi:hypothetical protein